VLIESSYKAEKRRKRKGEMMTINVASNGLFFYKSMTYEMMDIKEEKLTKCFFSFHLF